MMAKYSSILIFAALCILTSNCVQKEEINQERIVERQNNQVGGGGNDNSVNVLKDFVNQVGGGSSGNPTSLILAALEKIINARKPTTTTESFRIPTSTPSSGITLAQLEAIIYQAGYGGTSDFLNQLLTEIKALISVLGGGFQAPEYLVNRVLDAILNFQRRTTTITTEKSTTWNPRTETIFVRSTTTATPTTWSTSTSNPTTTPIITTFIPTVDTPTLIANMTAFLQNLIVQTAGGTNRNTIIARLREVIPTLLSLLNGSNGASSGNGLSNLRLILTSLLGAIRIDTSSGLIDTLVRLQSQ